MVSLQFGHSHVDIHYLKSLRDNYGASDLLGQHDKLSDLPFSAYHDIDDKKLKLLRDVKGKGDVKEALPISQMVRRDNATQRQRTNNTLGKSSNYYRDPRPLAQQFQEMNIEQMARKMVELELEEKITAYAPQHTRTAGHKLDTGLSVNQLLGPPREYLKTQDINEVLQSYRKKRSGIQLVDSSQNATDGDTALDSTFPTHMTGKGIVGVVEGGTPPLEATMSPTKLSRRSKMNFDERMHRLLTPQARHAKEARRSVQDYDDCVESTIAQTCATTRKRAVELHRKQHLAMREPVTDAPFHSSGKRRPATALPMHSHRVPTAAQLMRASAAASTVSAGASAFFAMSNRTGRTTTQMAFGENGKKKANHFYHNSLSPKPLPMDQDKKRLEHMVASVKAMRQSSRFKNRKSDEIEILKDNVTFEERSEEEEDADKHDDQKKEDDINKLDVTRPLMLGGAEFEFADVFKR